MRTEYEVRGVLATIRDFTGYGLILVGSSLLTKGGARYLTARFFELAETPGFRKVNR